MCAYVVKGYILYKVEILKHIYAHLSIYIQDLSVEVEPPCNVSSTAVGPKVQRAIELVARDRTSISIGSQSSGFVSGIAMSKLRMAARLGHLSVDRFFLCLYIGSTPLVAQCRDGTMPLIVFFFNFPISSAAADELNACTRIF